MQDYAEGMTLKFKLAEAFKANSIRFDAIFIEALEKAVYGCIVSGGVRSASNPVKDIYELVKRISASTAQMEQQIAQMELSYPL